MVQHKLMFGSLQCQEKSQKTGKKSKEKKEPVHIKNTV